MFIAKGQGAPRAPTVAPVCHISPAMQGAAPTQPRMPTIPPIMTPNVGPNGQIDWSGLINAMLAMKDAIEKLAGQRAPFYSFQLNRPGGGPNKSPDFGNFVEVSQQIKTEKVYNPDDRSQWIEVERVANLTMRDAATGQTWIWHR